MRKVLSVALVTATLACASNSADERILDHFALPRSTPAQEDSVRIAILAQLPPGTSENAVAAFVARNGVGDDALSRYYPKDSTGLAVVRVPLDPNGFTLVQPEWTVSFMFDSISRLHDVRVRRWLTGP